MKKILILIISLLVGACATQAPVIDLPSSKTDFELCKSSLMVKYPDIEKYERILRWNEILQPFQNPYPEYRSLHNKLGEPVKSRYSWVNSYPFILGGALGGPAGLGWALGYSALFGFTVLLVNPEKVETWEKGNYKIEANVRYPLVYWDGKLQYFIWNEVDKNNCKN